MIAQVSAQQLDCDRIVALAVTDCGAAELADAELIARVRQFVGWINQRGPYTGDQCAAMQRQLSQLLSRRLQLALDRRRYPEIAGERIERPIFVVGLPRSGTTLLHSLLAEDPDVVAPRVWHVTAPSPPPGAGPVAAARLARGQRAIDAIIDRVPGLLQLHPYWDQGAEALIEDEELFALDFRNAYPTQFHRVPTLEVNVDAAAGDVPGTYRFHRELLQHLQWNTGGRRWVCKGVYHQFLLEALLTAYPDAICVWPHRSFGEIHVSTVTIAAVLFNAINGGRIDWRRYARESAEQLRAGLAHALSSPLIDDPRIVHLRFTDIAADPVASIRRIHERARLPLSATHEQRMRAWLADPRNRADRYGRYPYSHQQFGLTREWVMEQFADYHRRFGLETA